MRKSIERAKEIVWTSRTRRNQHSTGGEAAWGLLAEFRVFQRCDNRGSVFSSEPRRRISMLGGDIVEGMDSGRACRGVRVGAGALL